MIIFNTMKSKVATFIVILIILKCESFLFSEEATSTSGEELTAEISPEGRENIEKIAFSEEEENTAREDFSEENFGQEDSPLTISLEEGITEPEASSKTPENLQEVFAHFPDPTSDSKIEDEDDRDEDIYDDEQEFELENVEEIVALTEISLKYIQHVTKQLLKYIEKFTAGKSERINTRLAQINVDNLLHLENFKRSDNLLRSSQIRDSRFRSEDDASKDKDQLDLVLEFMGQQLDIMREIAESGDIPAKIKHTKNRHQKRDIYSVTAQDENPESLGSDILEKIAQVSNENPQNRIQFEEKQQRIEQTLAAIMYFFGQLKSEKGQYYASPADENSENNIPESLVFKIDQKQALDSLQADEPLPVEKAESDVQYIDCIMKTNPCSKKGLFRFNQSCTKYYICEYNTRCNKFMGFIIYTCPKCLKFNAEKHKCDLPENVPECALPSRNKTCTGTGLFPVPEDCFRYYECKENRNGSITLTVKECPMGEKGQLTFNEKEKTCVARKCKERSNLCIYGNYGKPFVSDKFNCNKYYSCKRRDKVPEPQYCAKGLIWTGKQCEKWENSNLKKRWQNN